MDEEKNDTRQVHRIIITNPTRLRLPVFTVTSPGNAKTCGKKYCIPQMQKSELVYRQLLEQLIQEEF